MAKIVENTKEEERYLLGVCLVLYLDILYGSLGLVNTTCSKLCLIKTQLVNTKNQ